MKQYSFSNIKARPFPTINDINNPWIFGKVKCVINVSEHISNFEKEYAERGISYFHFPLKENVDDMGWENILSAVKVLIENVKNDIPTIVHCIGGNNRSRSVVEAAYFALNHEHLQDEYKGFVNHLVCNAENQFLPYTLEEIEQQLSAL